MNKEKLHIKIHFLLLVFLLTQGNSGIINAQQAPQFSLYHLQPAMVNPAWAGMEESLSITGLIRQQWVGLNGSPQTQLLLTHMPVYIINSSVLLGARRDVTGAFEMLEISGGYAYRITIGNNLDIQAGLSGTYIQSGLDGNKLRAPDGNYDENIIDHNDPRLPVSKAIGSSFAANAGIVVRNEWFDAGLAMYNINKPGINFEQEDVPSFQYSHYFTIFGRGRIPLVYPFQLMPAMAIRSDLVQTQTEFTANLNYLNNIEGGFTFRGYNFNTLDAIVMQVAFRIRGNTQIGYAYDIPVSTLRAANSGSHEIMLKFNLDGPVGKGIPPKIIYNPRYFN